MDNRFVKGLLRDNPLLCLALGVCPALAVTTYAVNGLALGVITCCVLVCATLVSCLLGKVSSEKGQLALYMMVSAAFAAVADLIVKANFPELSAALGIFVPLTAVSSLVLSRAAFAVDNTPGEAVADVLGMGIGYLCAMTVVGVVRELLAHGSVFGAAILPGGIPSIALPAGGFLVLGVLMGVFKAIVGKKDEEEDAQA